MKAALYVRVSTEEQAKEGFSINAQIEKVKAFCFSQGWDVYRVFKEEGRSAKNLDRPQLKEMLSEIKLFDVVIVYKLDRLSRSVGDINYLLNQFEKCNVAFKSVTEPYDTTTSQGKLLVNIFASLAQFEREQLAERTHMGMTRKHEEGQRNGGRAPFGYNLDENGGLKINDEEAKWVRWIFESFKARGKKTVAIELNQNGVRSRTGSLWNSSMIDYLINNPVYYGALRWNYRTKKGNRTYEEVIVPGKHEPIISEEEFNRVKALRRDRKGTGFKGHVTYPFTGILKCARCKNNMIGGKRKRADGSEYRFYKCTGRFTYGTCDMPVIAEDTIEKEFIINLEHIDVEIELPENGQVDTQSIKKELKRVRKRIENWQDMRAEGDITKQRFKEKMEIEKEKEAELIQLLESVDQTITLDNITGLIDSLKDNWTVIPLEQKKKTISGLFNKITIECLQSHKGGHGERPVIEIKEVEFAFLTSENAPKL